MKKCHFWSDHLKFMSKGIRLVCHLIGISFLTSPVFAQDQVSAMLQRADIYRDSSQWDSAIIYYQQAADYYTVIENWKKAIETGIKLNDVRISGIQFEAAQKGLERLEVQATQYLKSDDLVLAHIFDQKGRLGIESGAYKNGKEELLKSLAIKKSLGLEDNDIGLTYFQLGNAYREMGDLEKGMEAYQKCLSIREKISGKKSIESIPVYTNIATLLKNSNRFEEALDMYLTCDSAILNHYGSEDKQRAAILNGIAIVYAQTGRYPEALQYFTNLLKIDRQTLGEKHPYLARTYSNLGILHELMGDYQSAQDFHKKSLAIKLESFEPENPNLISDYQGLSTIMTHIGDIDQALIYQQQVLQIERASYSPSDPRIGTTYEMLAANLISKGEYEEAWKNLQMSEKIYLHNGKYSLQLGSVYHSMAIILLSQHQDPEALVYAFQALKINKKLGTNHPHVAGNYELIGNIYLNQHQIDSAKHQYQLALQINEKVYGKKHLSVASNYGQLAEAYFDSGDYDQALDYIQRALNAATEGFSYRTISDNPTPEQTLAPSTVATLLGKKGKILNHQANLLKDLNLLLEASHTFEAAISMIDAAQFSYKAQGSVLTLREELDPVFEQAIEVTYQLFDQTQDKIYIDRAFQISEKNKAALLVSALNESRARTFAEIPDSLIEEENRLQRDLTYFEQLLSEEKTTEQSDDQKIKEIQSNIFRLKNQYDLLIESYNRLYPRYYDLKYNAQPITIEQVQKKLTNYHGLLIEYYLGQEHLYIFVISHTQEHLYRLNLSEEFQSTIDSFKTKLISNNDDPKTFQQSSNELYNILIGPFDNLLTNQKITIIPDGELGYIPFEILVEDTNDVSSFDLPYLLKNHVISYAYSATYLEDQRAKEELKNDIKYIAFAPNFRGRNDQGTSLKPDLLASRQVVRGSLSELKGATREVESLASNFQGRYFQNLEATETQFKKFAQDYDIIHLATHAIIDEVNPLNSRLLFTIDGDTLNDGDLNAWELFNMNLHAKLSVLSACNTGFGKIQKGEGILSLGRAFAFAGCPSRLMSLWPAQDASTADIMIKFYEYLAEGMAKDEALRKAKLAYLKNAAEFNMHPFYWAGFVLQGDPSAIINNSHIKYYLIGLSGVILLGFFLNKRFGYTKNRAEPSKKSI